MIDGNRDQIERLIWAVEGMASAIKALQDDMKRSSDHTARVFERIADANERQVDELARIASAAEELAGKQ